LTKQDVYRYLIHPVKQGGVDTLKPLLKPIIFKDDENEDEISVNNMSSDERPDGFEDTYQLFQKQSKSRNGQM